MLKLLGFTVPFNVAELDVIFEASFVIVIKPESEGDVVNVISDPKLINAPPVARTRKWYVVLGCRSLIVVLTLTSSVPEIGSWSAPVYKS